MRPKYRICHVIDDLGLAGGAEQQLIQNLKAMDNSCFENFVCYLRDKDDLARILSQSGIRAVPLGLKSKFHWPRAALRLFRFVRSTKIDLLHSSVFESDLVGCLVGRLAGVRVVTTLVNNAYEAEWLIDNPHLNRIKLGLVKLLAKLVLRTCPHHFIAISEYVKQSAIRNFCIPEGKITVIHRAVSREWMEPESPVILSRLRHQLNLDGASPILLNVGRLAPQKGQKYLLQAMSYILKEFPESRLLIVGKGFMQEELSILRDKLKIDKQVYFLGKRTDIKQLLQMADIFVFPSLFEGLGVALLEAAALGKPCIASSVGPVPEVIKDGKSGLLVSPRSPEALAQAIVRFSKDPEEAQAMGHQAQERVLKMFTIDQTIQKLQAVYVKVLDEA